MTDHRTRFLACLRHVIAAGPTPPTTDALVATVIAAYDFTHSVTTAPALTTEPKDEPPLGLRDDWFEDWRRGRGLTASQENKCRALFYDLTRAADHPPTPGKDS